MLFFNFCSKNVKLGNILSIIWQLGKNFCQFSAFKSCYSWFMIFKLLYDISNLIYIIPLMMDDCNSYQFRILITISVFLAKCCSIAKCKHKICNLRISGHQSDFIVIFGQVFEQ